SGNPTPPFDVHPSAAQGKDLRSGFLPFRDAYQRNWKNLEFGTAEAFALDRTGNIYVASHAFADITVRKYDPQGSRLLYSDVIRAWRRVHCSHLARCKRERARMGLRIHRCLSA